MRNLAIQMIFAGASVVCASGLVAFSDPAVARTPDVPQMVVHYSQADLTSETGRADIARRVRVAASKVCGADDVDSSHLVSAAEARCQKETVARANGALDLAVARQSDRLTQIAVR